MTQLIMSCVGWLIGIIAVYFMIHKREGIGRSSFISLNSVSLDNRLELVSRWGLRD
ncbi:MAG: hypothetical protein GY795_31455 [Desulfobacterales bacterium]|nr:hypothetical protein [Desulfobacterales bacterium]